MSYGPNLVAMWGRTAFYVDKILKGADPANLPVEQPAKFEFTALVANVRYWHLADIGLCAAHVCL